MTTHLANRVPTTEGSHLTSCPFRGCRGEQYHAGPHLFEALDIEQIEKVAAIQATVAENGRLITIIKTLPESATRVDVLDAVSPRECHLDRSMKPGTLADPIG